MWERHRRGAIKEIWDIVQDKVLPEIITNKSSGEGHLRIWSAGCSTGEETYSLAIAVKEILRKENIKDLPVFIYGTDIMEDKLEEAKRAIYNEEKLKDINISIKFRYFERITEAGPLSLRAPKGRSNLKQYTLNTNTKRLTHFRRYDLVKQESLAGFDLIVCRNVLIYFQCKLQEKVIRHFHKALRPEGILWLGKSETLWGETGPLFEPIYKNEKIFRKV